MADALALTVAPAGDVVAIDLWKDATPDFRETRAVRVEPRRWWLIDAGGDADALAAALREDGAATPIGGGLMRATMTGAGWRQLLMIGGVFDAEDASFGPGDCAATIIHQVPVWIAPVADDCAEVFFAASYASGLVAFWRAAITRGMT